MISVTIPCWNDAAALQITLDALSSLRGDFEVIVADASNTPECIGLAHRFGARTARVEEPNRGRQLNAGAALARGNVLLFHHADTRINEAHLRAVDHALEDPHVVGGGFHRKFDDRHPALRWMEGCARLYNHWGTIFGDQSVFVRRGHFHRLGGFAPIPLMGDIEFSRRLRRSGRTVLLDPPIETSARRHHRKGSWPATMQNAWLIFLFKCGVSPERLHRRYYTRELANRERAHVCPPAAGEVAVGRIPAGGCGDQRLPVVRPPRMR